MELKIFRNKSEGVYDVIDGLKKNQCHVVTFAEVGLSVFSACCEFGYNITQEHQNVFAERINNAQETGTLYPKANITVLPIKFFRSPIHDPREFQAALNDAFIAERDYVKSTKMILEFNHTDLNQDIYETTTRELIENKFSDLPGVAYLMLGVF